MANRVTGMYSGLDTESLIEELVSAKSTKVTTYKNSKTKLEWKQEKWTDLNSQIKSLFSGTLNTLKYESNYSKKATTVSNSSAVSVITGDDAMNSVQTLSIKQLAQSGYLTGSRVESASGTTVTDSTTIASLMGDDFAAGSFQISTGGKTTSIDVTSTTTVSDIEKALKSAGVSANFDETNQRMFIGASSSGSDNDFALTGNNEAGLKIMSALGINAAMTKDTNDATYSQYQKLAALDGTSLSTILSDSTSDAYKLLKSQAGNGDLTDSTVADAAYAKLTSMISVAKTVTSDSNTYSSYTNTDAKRLEGQNSVIELNGAQFTSSTNTVEVNGLTFTANAVADDITVTTQDDTDGIYNMIKSFLKEYNELIIKMDKLYNADSADGYDVLTDEEKEAMSDTEVEDWENKIKDSLLRKDSTLGTIFNSLKDIMAGGIKIDNNTTLYLSNFGINTQSYFEAADNEKAAYHIDGDPDDSASSGNTDKLKSMIATDSKTVVSFFSKLAQSLYDELSGLSGNTTNSSYGSFYDDKKMKTDLSDWDDKIDDAEEELEDYEDKWYSKFSSMETALSKLDSKSSYISNLFS